MLLQIFFCLARKHPLVVITEYKVFLLHLFAQLGVVYIVLSAFRHPTPVAKYHTTLLHFLAKQQWAASAQRFLKFWVFTHEVVVANLTSFLASASHKKDYNHNDH